MTIKATKFTPEVLLSAPKRSAGIPNGDGSKILHSVSAYSFRDHKSTTEIRVLNAATNESAVVTGVEGASEPHWIDDEKVLLLISGKNGSTDVVIGDLDDFDKTKYTAGNIEASASGVKIKKVSDSTYIFAVTALSLPNGELYNSEKAPKRQTSGKLYDSLFVRHWDAWITPNRNSIWYGTLNKSSADSNYTLSDLTNALKGTKLQSPIPPFGGTEDYDISEIGLAFVAKDPDLNVATHTKQNLYIAIWSKKPGEALQPLQKINVSGFEGATTNPKFSHDGSSIAFTSMRKDGYEADKNQIFVIPDVKNPQWLKTFFSTPDGLGNWDRSPSGISWSHDGKTLYIQAEDESNRAIFKASSTPSESKAPEVIFRNGTATDVRVLQNGHLFISGSNLVDNSVYFQLDPSAAQSEPKLISSNSKQGSAFGLSADQISDIWYEGEVQKIHALVVKPSDFDSSKKYPLAYLIHGGPQGAWTNGWSTRWNPAVFAEQGYVVVCPNPTGSTGYGQKLTDAIQTEWGGLPYNDIVRGFEYVGSNLKYVDMDRAVALGASYGGYMVNWIQGHDLGRKFKALVTHDGVFSMAGQLASEELYFPNHEFGGSYMSNPSSWLQWDPARFADKWATPHLIIHNDKDYRLTIAEGLSAFNVLQQNHVPSKFLTFPDENHWVLKPENSLVWHAVVIGWINKYVGLPEYGTEGYAKVVLDEATVSR